MTSEESNFPASDYKLSNLRKSGIVPHSYDVLTFAIILGLVLWGFIWGVSAGDLIKELFRSSINSFTPEVAMARFCNIFSFISSIIAKMVCCIVVSTIFFGLLQTRFLICTSKLSIDFSKLLSLENLALKRICFSIILYVSYIIKGCIWCIVGLYSSFYVFSGLVNVISVIEVAVSWGFLYENIKTYFLYLSGVCLGFSFICCIIGRFLAGVVFMQEHKMSRSEMEAEMREMESNQEIKRRLMENLANGGA